MPSTDPGAAGEGVGVEGAFPNSWFEADFYGDLGVNPDASDKEIRDAFKRIAKDCHPDLGGDASEKLAAASPALKVLGSPESRRRYDSFKGEQRERARLKAEDERRRQADAERVRREAAMAAERARAAQAQRQEPYEQPSATVTFVVNGVRVEVRGSSSEATLLAQLAALRGTDLRLVSNGTAEHFHSGFRILAPDQGWVEFAPATAPGEYRVPGRGSYAPFGGPRGDLYVDVRYLPTRGGDFVQTLKLPGEAWWTGHTTVSVLDGKAVRIPAETNAGRWRIPGRGWAGEFGGSDGDLYVELTYTSPVPSKGRRRFNRVMRATAKAVSYIFVGAAMIMAVLFIVVLAVTYWRSG